MELVLYFITAVLLGEHFQTVSVAQLLGLSFSLPEGFGVQVSWSVPGITHLSTPGSILEISGRSRLDTALRPHPEMGSALCSPERHLRTEQSKGFSDLLTQILHAELGSLKQFIKSKTPLTQPEQKTSPLSTVQV